MPMTDTAANPLLTSSPLPLFDAIRPEHVSPALDVLLADANAALETAVAADTPADYDTLSRTLDEILHEPVTAEKLARMDFLPVGGTPEAFAAFIAADTQRWKQVVDSIGLEKIE